MSNLTIYLEERFIYFDGNYYSQVYDDISWDEYLNVFEGVIVVARVKRLDSFNPVQEGYKKTENKKVVFYPLNDYQGLLKGTICLPITILKVFLAVQQSQANLLRLPGLISNIAGIYAIFLNKKFSTQLVGDPYDVFSSGVGGKFSPFLRIVFTYLTKMITVHATAAAYVTNSTLQRRYPPNSKAYTISYSDVKINPTIFNKKNIRKSLARDMNIIKFLMVGSLEQRYKGFDIALKAIASLDIKQKIEIHIVGDGIYFNELKDLAKDLNLFSNIRFHGKIAHEQVFELMSMTDIFLMPSRTEGLPRVLIEAMAMGLPAIGSNVGGIPELLNNSFLFEKENDQELANLIEKMINKSNQDIEIISAENIEKAREYEGSVLSEKKINFYNAINVCKN